MSRVDFRDGSLTARTGRGGVCRQVKLYRFKQNKGGGIFFRSHTILSFDTGGFSFSHTEGGEQHVSTLYKTRNGHVMCLCNVYVDFKMV